MTTLTDDEIAAEIKANRLIRNGDLARLAGACYELRMGDVYYDLTEGGSRIALAVGQAALIKPGHRVVLITKEELDVPADILTRVVSKGSLFSVGLSPVATYADPGFSGNLGVVTQNISDKYVELPQGEPVAKADFTRLTDAASTLYNGQHGFQMGIWPIKSHLQKTHAEVAGDPRVKSEREEAMALLPAATRTVLEGIERRQAWIDIGLAFAVVLNATMIFLVNGKIVDSYIGLIGNLAASALIALLGPVARFFLKRT